jgi:hypothetical protein
LFTSHFDFLEKEKAICLQPLLSVFAANKKVHFVKNKVKTGPDFLLQPR